ncbi:MAG: 3-phosphoshikimate 1-carboxyvinyltransferase [Deltaproteobacteria bacterium]|nr:3-phosphoshikimate 1-carboxyvinyltransferase [Deltaproteobacteria bacterium]
MKLRIPPSKSITHRALFCAAMAQGESVLVNPLVCDDTLASVGVLRALGIEIQLGEPWRVHGGTFKKPFRPLDCNESGTTYRFVTALTDVLQIPCEITGKPSLLRRPQRPDPQISSQYLSGLLLAKDLSIATPLVSKSYVDLTLSVQKVFGVTTPTDSYKPASITIEADWSSAAFLLALGVLCDGVELEGLNPDSLQGDKAIVTILKEMGGDIFWRGEKLVARKSKLKGLRWDFDATPDLYPIAAVLCRLAEGKSELTGLERLRLKESDRLAATHKIVTWCHLPAGRQGPPGDKKALVVDSKDHRIIMAAAVWAKAKGQTVKFKYPEAVSKSWPGFWETLDVILSSDGEESR